MVNCFSNNNIFTNDDIDGDELKKELETFTDGITDWISIHSDAVDQCIAVLKPDFEDIKNTKWVQKCNRIPVRMLLCLNDQYFAKCPDKYFQNDSKN